MSDTNQLNVSWYQTERQAQRTMQQLSGLQELEFYLSHPDEYIRHQAILRLGQLRLKEALAPLSKIIDDPLETQMNRELAAWVLKSSGLVGSHDYYLGSKYLDKFTGDEKLKDFYYPYFIESRTKPEYHFKPSGIESMLEGETLMIKAESLEDKVDLPFSVGQWFTKWLQMKIRRLQEAISGIGRKITEKLNGAAEKGSAMETAPAMLQDEAGYGEEAQPDIRNADDIDFGRDPASNLTLPEKEQKPAMQTEATKPFIDVEKPKEYSRPFTLIKSPDEEPEPVRPGSRMIYVRERVRERTFGEALTDISGKFLRVLLLPFVILWNQKLVFLTLITGLYLFITFVPLGRMLFYKRAPEIARLNDEAVQSIQLWVSDNIKRLQKEAAEYELVRDIQKQLAAKESGPEEENTKTARYIVTSNTLNLRKGPGVQAEKLKVLQQNMVVEFLDESQKLENGETWLYIKAPDGTMGWSYSGYLKKLEEGLEAYDGQ